MRKHYIPVVLAAVISAFGYVSTAQHQQLAAAAYAQNLSKAPLLFTENLGQVADDKNVLRPDILFTAQSSGAKIYLSATGIHYQFTKVDYPAGYQRDERVVQDREKQEALQKDIKYSTHRFTLSLAGASPAPIVRKEAQSAYSENFYLAQCPQGVTGVHTYARLVYQDVYPGIDWIIYSNTGLPDGGVGGGMKYDFIVHPGADPSSIRLVVKDALEVNITKAGELLMKTSLGEVREHAPESFCGGKKVATKFLQTRAGISFDLGDYDKGQDLRIDPNVVWATYYGGTGAESAGTCVTDAAGNVYQCGTTTSSSGMASGGFQNTIGTGGNNLSDAYLVKFSSSGARLWATYYGGSQYESGRACATDALGNVYLCGSTNSASGMASGGFQNALSNGVDAFLVKFNGSGNRIWGTYYGGNGNDQGASCATDGSGNIYMTGVTASGNGIASGGFQNSYGGMGVNLFGDAFLVKFNSSGSRQWGTYYGSGADEAGIACTTDAAGNIYLAGQTTAASSAIAFNGHQNYYGGNSYDAFLAKFNSAGNRLWGTLYGGNGMDIGFSCATDASGNVFLAGISWSSTGIASGGFQNVLSGTPYADAFLAKFNSAGVRQWATYYGGPNSETGYSCATDNAGNIFLAGTTGSSTGIASGGMQHTLGGGYDAFLVKFNTSGNRLWGTYYGGPGDDYDAGYCATDLNGNIFLSSTTNSLSGIATANGFQTSFGTGTYDAFLVKIADTPVLRIDTVFGAVFCAGAQVHLTWTAYLINNPGNISAQLSDASGSFTSPTTLTPIGTGLTLFQIPFSIPSGTHYRIRLVCSSPVVISPDNGADLTIITIPAQPGPITGNTNVCIGSGQLYSIAPVPDAVTYNWSLPATWSGSSTTTSILTTVGSSGGIISVTASNACGTSGPATLNVAAGTNILIMPAVSLPSHSVLCSGARSILTASATNAGSHPVYQWKKNGVNVGTDSVIYADPALVTGDIITVTLTSNAPCAAPGSVTSNADTVTIIPSTIPGININTIPPIILCKGTLITFVTNNVGAGSAPTYQWYKNGVAIGGATAATYTDSILNNGDTLTIAMYSSAACPITQPTISNHVGVTVAPVLVTGAVITANPGTNIIPGQPVTFTAAPVNGGTAPEYLWFLNGNPIPFNTTDTWTAYNLRDGDVVRVRMESKVACPNPPLVYSNSLSIRSNAAGTGSIGALHDINVYPNPATAFIIIEGAQGGKVVLLSVIGQLISRDAITGNKQKLSLSDLAAGTYMLMITDKDGATGTIRITKE